TLPDFWLYDEVADGLDILDVELETEAGFGTASADFAVGQRTLEVIVDNGGQNDPVGTATDPELTVRILASVNQLTDAETQMVSELNGPVYDEPSINSFSNQSFISWNQVDEDADPEVSFGNSYLDEKEIRETYNDLASNLVSINVREPDLNVFSKVQANQT